MNNKYQQLKSDLGAAKLSLDAMSPAIDQVLRKVVSLKSELISVNKIMRSLAKSAAKSFGQAVFGGARSGGGQVVSGRRYLVGEKGPEMFVPKAAGQIVPSNQLGGKSLNVTMNINTPDADSFKKSQNQIMAEMAAIMRQAGRNL